MLKPDYFFNSKTPAYPRLKKDKKRHLNKILQLVNKLIVKIRLLLCKKNSCFLRPLLPSQK